MTEIEIVTEKTKLRLIELSDLDSIHNLHSLPETDEYNALGIPKDVEETKSIIEPWIAENKLSEIKNYTFAIENTSNGEFIGLFSPYLIELLFPKRHHCIFYGFSSFFKIKIIIILNFQCGLS